MKIAVAGKGGVGKTTIAGVLAHLFARDGFSVLAIDNDASMNLCYSIGIPPETRENIVPISKMTELIQERTSISGSDSGIYNINPKVSDIPDRFLVEGPNGIKLLALGTIQEPSSGCFCPGNALIRTLLYELLVRRDEAIIVDFEAGIEHLGRGTAKGVDLMAIVTEPSAKSIELSLKIADLTRQLGIKVTGLIFNKVRNEAQHAFLQERALPYQDIPILGTIPLNEDIAEADLKGESLFLTNPKSPAINAIRDVYQNIRNLLEPIAD